MPRKSKFAGALPPAAAVPIPATLLDELVTGLMTPTEVQVVVRSFKQALIERAMGAELTHHLGYREGEARP